MKAKFPKEDLSELLDEDIGQEYAGYTLVDREHTGTSRWANIYQLTFKYADRYYAVHYRQGTGDEGERPFEHDPDWIECVEVKPVEITVTRYELVD